MTEEFFERIERYIEENFIEYKSNVKFSMDTSETSWIKWKLDKILSYFKQTFAEYLLEYIAKRGLSEVDVYKKACLDRRLFSKLRNERKYMPSKRTLLAIALAMELTLDEAEELLQKAGYSLSCYSKEDVIIKFFFENQIYDLFTVNETLDLYGFKPLGS